MSRTIDLAGRVALITGGGAGLGVTEAGATRAGFTVLRLPLEIKDLFREWLEENRPDRASRVMSLVRQSRGGRDYDARWGSRMVGSGAVAELLKARFAVAVRKYGLNRQSRTADLSQFKVPATSGGQMDLFG